MEHHKIRCSLLLIPQLLSGSEIMETQFTHFVTVFNLMKYLSTHLTIAQMKHCDNKLCHIPLTFLIVTELPNIYVTGNAQYTWNNANVWNNYNRSDLRNVKNEY